MIHLTDVVRRAAADGHMGELAPVALPAGKFDSGSWGAVRGASDGQRTLTLILGKAMMLARDTEITDPAILCQR